MPPFPQKPWKRKSDGAYYTHLNGKRIYLSKDRKTAWEKFKRIQQAGTAPSSLTVRQLLDEYWKWLKANRAPETADRRALVLKSFGESIPKSLKAESIRPHHVQTWLNENAKVKVPKKIKGKMESVATGRDVSPTTIHGRITVIAAVFNWAKRMRYINDNPLAQMPKPTPHTRQEFVPADLWHRVLEVAHDDSFRDFLRVMLGTGCRVTEIVKFEAQHFDGKAMILPITQSKGRKRSRVVYLPDLALEIVRRLIKEYPEGKLFRNARGNPWDRNSVRCRFRGLKTKLDMPWLTATHLRHSFAHYRLTQGQDALTVAKLMGHVDTRMLSTRYGHLDQNSDYMVGAANQIGFPENPEGTSPSLPA